MEALERGRGHSHSCVHVSRDLSGPFCPTHTGSLSDFVGRTLFRLLRRRPPALSLAGPPALVIVILCWAFLQAIGFALIYWAGFPAFQALAGLALVTASVSWIVLLYPALGRLGTLARRSWILAKAEKETGVSVISGDAQSLLGELAPDVIRTRVDLIHFPILYYFHADTDRAALPGSLLYLNGLANRTCKTEFPERVCLAAAALRAALQDLAKTIGERFLNTDTADPEVVFKAYAEDHITHTPEP